MAIRTRYTFWKFSTYYISLIYVSVEVLTQRFILTANSLTYLWLKRNFWLNHDHWSSVCPLPFFCLTIWRPSQRSWVQEKKSKIDCTSFGSIEICYSTIHWTKCYAFSSSSCKYMIWSLWPRSCTYRWIAAKNQIYCRPKDYFRKKIGLAQPKFFFQQFILSL